MRQIASHLGLADSATLLELLDILLSAEEADWITALPATPQQLAVRLGKDPEHIATGLKDLFMRGLVLIAEHTEQGPRYVFDSNPGRLTDMILFDPRYRRLGDHFLDLWRDLYNQELVHTHRSPDQLPFRILPIEETVQDNRGILPYERVTEIVRQARRIAVQSCPCRLRERACDAPLEVCISLDRVADYMTSRHIGREIDAEEALAILRQTEELGLIHEVENTEHPTVICACCPCCCVFLRAITRYQKEHVIAKSRYGAVIDREKCAGCGTCLKRCHFDAIQTEKDRMSVQVERCLGCGSCAFACPNHAIRMVVRQGAMHIPRTEDTFMHGIDEIPSIT